KEIDEFLDGVIEDHVNKNKMADGNVDGGNDQSQYLVDILLDVQREDTTNFIFDRGTIKAVIMDVFPGGTDTSTLLEWALSELVRHPHIMKELQTEVTKIVEGRSMITEDDTQNMHYLKAVLKETLRLHPPLPLLVPRRSRLYVKLMGYDIAQGTQVMVNVWAIARDPLLWDEPDKFKPQRFLNSSIDYKGLDFELLPFGAGRRGCPGIQFSAAIRELALANILYKYDLALPSEGKPEDLDMHEIFGLTVHKESPLIVMTTSRF
ncbi:cytochrome P450 71A4-like protein, partial [Tanacetum coccineum]